MKTGPKWISSVLAVLLVLSFWLLIADSALAATSADDANALSALGFDTSAEPEGYNSSADAANPYGVNSTTVSPVGELYTATGSSGALYGDNLSLGVSANSFYADKDAVAAAPAYNAYRTAAGSFTGNGLNGQLATVAANIYQDDVTTTDVDETAYSLDLYLSDPKSGDPVADSQKISLLVRSQIFGNVGRYDKEDFAKYPYQLQNYLQVAAGDFTGDGIDEIAVYIPERGNSRVEVYQLQIGTGENAESIWKNADKWKLLWTHYLREGTYVSNMVSLTAGDMTGDGVDDLGITWGVYYGQSYKTSCQAVVLHGSKSGKVLQTSTGIDLTFDGTQIVRAALALGDSDGDGKNELVLGGQLVSDIDNGDCNTRFLAAYDFYNKSGEFICTAAGNMDIVNPDEADEDGVYYSNPAYVANLAVVKQDGVGTQEYIYLDSILYLQSGSGFSIYSELDEDNSLRTNKRTNQYYGEYGAVAADLNGDGKETVLTMQNFLPYDVQTIQTVYWWIFPIGHETVTSLIPGESFLRELSTSADSNVARTVDYVGQTLAYTYAVPDTDTDTMLLNYTGKHYLAYTDPKVLAVLAAPPYFGDLEHLDGGDSYVGNSQTAYSSISGGSSSNTVSGTIFAGAYVSFEQEVSFFGIKAAKFEAEVEVTASATAEFESAKSRTQTVEYGTAGGQDTVVLYSLPMDVYIYDAYVPVTKNGSVTWEKQTMTINIPYDACVKTFTLEDYDAIAADYDELPIIGNTDSDANGENNDNGDSNEPILTHTLGDPSTYPSSTAGFSNVNIYDGNYAGVGYGSSGFITQSLELTTENSVGLSASVGISMKVGAGAGGTVVGVTCGAEAGFGTVTTNLTGKSFSGTVVGMPEEAEGYGYNYNWKVFQYTYSGTQTFPVVTYLVNNVTSPPELPADFALDTAGTTDESIKLTWSSTASPAAGYQIYRHYDFPDGSGDYTVGNIIDATDMQYYDPATGKYQYSFTDTNLNPYTEYQYRIQVIGAAAPYYSVLSDVLNARTKASEGQPTITLSAYELRIYPDKDAAVTVSVTNNAAHVQAPLYQWQKQVDGVWTSLNGKTAATLTFSLAGISDAGLYRCRVNQMVGEYAISAYSEVITVDYAKRTADMEFAIEKAVLDDKSPVLTAELINTHTDSGSVATGTVTFAITGIGYSKAYTVAVVDGVAACSDWTAPADGIYQVTAYYSGSRVFKAVNKTELFLAGNNADYWLEADDSIIYGNSLTPVVSKYAYQDSDVVKTELTNNALDEYSISYKVYKAVNYQESPAAITEYLANTYGSDNWYYTQLYTNWYPTMKVWLPLDGTYTGYASPVSGDSITPRAVGSYRVEVAVELSEGGTTTTADTLTKEFSVTQRPISIMAPTKTMTQSNAAQPTAANLTVTDGTFVFGDSFVSLGLGVKCFNTGGTEEAITTGTKPGEYSTRVVADSANATAQANYSFTLIDGRYIIVGAAYPVNITAEELLGKTVGQINVLSPDDYQAGKEYQMSTQLTFVAAPANGYVVKGWKVNGVAVDLSALVNPKVLTQTMPANALNVSVSFAVASNTLSFSGTNGSVECVDSQLIKSGDTVLKNAAFTFKAIPAAGYHFKEWWLIANGTTYPAGDLDAEGYHTYTLTMGDVSASLYAVFERDSYLLTLGDNLVASYLWDHDKITTTPDVKKYVLSGEAIAGDTQVTVEPATGYRIADNGQWYKNGAALILTADDPLTPEDETVYYSGQSYTFGITGDTNISATAELQHYDVTVSADWSGGGQNPGGNSVCAKVNGVAKDLDQLSGLAGGTAVTFTAVPAYGAVFEKWTVNGVDIDQAALANPLVYTCAALGSDLEIKAVFKANERHAVAVTKGIHGSLSYTLNGGAPITINANEHSATEILVYAGDTLIFSAVPDANFMVGNWIIDGTVHQSTIKTWTLSAINSDRTVAVSFTPMVYYTVNFSAGANGSLTAVLDGDYTMTSGDKPGGGTSINFTALPDSGYMVDAWTVNGETLKTNLGTDYVAAAYEIAALAGNTAVEVSFRPECKWAVTVSEAANSVTTAVYSPDDYPQSGYVRDGATVVFTTTPAAGYALTAVTVNGKTLNSFDKITENADGSWTCTVNCVTEDIAVSAAAAKLYRITISSAKNGSATADLTNAVAGKRVNLTASANTDYKFEKWTVTAEDSAIPVVIDTAAAASTYLIMPASNVTITPSFTYAGGSSSPSGGGGGGGEDASSGKLGVGGVSVPYTFSSGSLNLQLDENLVAQLASGAKQSGITLDLSKLGKVTEASLPAASGILAKAQSLTVVLTEAGITFDADALGTLAAASGDGAVNIRAEQAAKSSLTAAQQAAVGDRPVYDFTLMANGKQISTLGGKAKIAIPYTLGKAEEPGKLTIWYLSDSGNLTEIPCTYDAVSGTVSFSTDHFSYYVVGYKANPFKDVLSGAWYCEAVAFVNQRGLFNGTSATTFSPNVSMTRAMFVTVLGRLAKVDPSLYTSTSFTDVPAGQWYSAYIEWAVQKHIITGYGNGSFGANDALTREQMSVILANYLQAMNITLPSAANTTQFNDQGQISGWAQNAVQLMQTTGLLQGNEAKLFAPQKTATRAEVATVLMRFVEAME